MASRSSSEKSGIGRNGHFRLDSVSAQQRKNAETLSREHSLGIKGKLQAAADSSARTADKNEQINAADASAGKNVATYRAKSKKASLAADSIGKPESVGFTKLINRRVNSVEDASINVEDGGSRLEGHDGSIAGQGFYFDNHVPERVEAHASAALSSGEPPVNEQTSLRALREGRGSVVQVNGKQYNFSDMEGEHVARTAKNRKKVTPETVSGNPVDWTGIARVSKSRNIADAHEILGERHPGMDPLSDPKRNAYAESLTIAKPDSPEELEYKVRASDVGSTYRGDRMPGQTSLDITGLKHSNEGVLSNKLDTPQDTWMHTNSYGSGADAKAMGDQTFSRKQTEDKGVVSRNAKVKADTIQHAVGSFATQKAAERIQKDLGMESTVPAMLVQETVWASQRRNTAKSTRARNATADPEYNQARQKTAKQAKLEEAKTRAKNWPIDEAGQLKGQKSLF